MGEISHRLRTAIAFLKRNGLAKNNIEIAAVLGLPPSTISMYVQGTRTPNGEFLLNFCDHYPIRLEWLRFGGEDMIKDTRELSLLKRIEELERKIAELEAVKKVL